MKHTMDSTTALKELRALVGTYLEGSDDAARAAELLDAIDTRSGAKLDITHAAAVEAQRAATREIASASDLEHLRSGKGGTTRAMSEGRKPEPISSTDPVQEDRERLMFGCTTAALDQKLDGKEPRDVAMFAMGTLSDAQELIGRGAVSERDANTIRQRMNVAKYAIDKAVPR